MIVVKTNGPDFETELHVVRATCPGVVVHVHPDIVAPEVRETRIDEKAAGIGCMRVFNATSVKPSYAIPKLFHLYPTCYVCADHESENLDHRITYMSMPGAA